MFPYQRMVKNTVTYVSFHGLLLNKDSRKDLITITEISTGFSPRKKDDTIRSVFLYRITITELSLEFSFNKEITSEQL